MTMFRKVLVAAAAVLTLSAPAFAADSDNLQTFRAVQKQVLNYNHFTIFDTVNTQIDRGVVKLTGKVTMPYKRDDIEKRVRQVAGVQRVDNRLEVLPVSQWDDQLRLGIANAIYSNPAFRQFASSVNPPIHVIVEHGHVTLDGVVLSEVDRAIARSIVGNFAVFSVNNQLKTEAEVKEELEHL
jgi:hyperosmotically inducible periplasmic protein